MHPQTSIVKLEDQELSLALFKEANSQTFSNHADGQYTQTGALRHGTTAWIKELSLIGDRTRIDNTGNFPLLLDYLSARFGLFSTLDLGRAYWHKLAPGQSIDPHTDATPYFQKVDRFQFFPTYQRGFKAILGGTNFQIHRGALVAFNSAEPHSYSNDSDSMWYFLVFDLYPGRYELVL